MKTKEEMEIEEKELEEKAKKMAAAIKSELGLDEIREEIRKEYSEALAVKESESVLKVFVAEDAQKAVSELTKEEKVKAFSRAIFHGDHVALKALSEGGASGADGGYTVPQDFYNTLLAEIYEETMMRSLVTVVPMKTNVLTLSMIDHGPDVFWTSEGATKTTTTADFTQPTITAYKMAAIIYLTDELMDDSAFDLSSVLISRFAKAIAREEDKVIIAGTGTGQPTGITAAGASVPTVTCVGNLSFDNMLSLIGALPVKFRKNATFLINPTNTIELMKLKDSQGRYLWNQSLVPGQPSTILGYPVVENYWMPEAKIAFGDFKEAYWLGDRQRMTVKISNDTETTFTQDKTAIRIVERIGGTVIFPNAARLLVTIP